MKGTVLDDVKPSRADKAMALNSLWPMALLILLYAGIFLSGALNAGPDPSYYFEPSVFPWLLFPAMGLGIFIGFVVLRQRVSGIRNRCSGEESILPGEAIVPYRVPASAYGVFLGLRVDVDAIAVLQGAQEVARWDWASITEVSVAPKRLAARRKLAVTVTRGDDSDTFFVLGDFGVASDALALALAGNLRRFGED